MKPNHHASSHKIWYLDDNHPSKNNISTLFCIINLHAGVSFSEKGAGSVRTWLIEPAVNLQKSYRMLGFSF